MLTSDLAKFIRSQDFPTARCLCGKFINGLFPKLSRIGKKPINRAIVNSVRISTKQCLQSPTHCNVRVCPLGQKITP